MGYSADKGPLIGHVAGPIRRLKPLGAQRQEQCGPHHLTRKGLHATTPRRTDTGRNSPDGETVPVAVGMASEVDTELERGWHV